jgi:hypothetical protein
LTLTACVDRLDKERTLLEQTLETLYLEIENILEPEPQSAGGDRPVVGRSFSNFVQGICSLAFQCFTAENRQRANNACGTGTKPPTAVTFFSVRVVRVVSCCIFNTFCSAQR